MSFKPAKCPNCAGDLQVPEDRDTVKCMYCGSDIVVREAIKDAVGTVNIENLMMLAKNAEESKNPEEAYKYYSMVLEYDAKNIEAWIGKGNARPDDITQMRSCFKKAMTYSSDKEKTDGEIKKSINIFIDKSRKQIDNPDSLKKREEYVDMLLDLYPNDHDGLMEKGSILCKRFRASCVEYFKAAHLYANNKEETRNRIIKVIRRWIFLANPPTEIDHVRSNIQIIKDYFREIDINGDSKR
jgi:tetratricopeptide (TPR) repeat protein